ncbi:hypothetical protein [Salipiger sp.]
MREQKIPTSPAHRAAQLMADMCLATALALAPVAVAAALAGLFLR